MNNSSQSSETPAEVGRSVGPGKLRLQIAALFLDVWLSLGFLALTLSGGVVDKLSVAVPLYVILIIIVGPDELAAHLRGREISTTETSQTTKSSAALVILVALLIGIGTGLAVAAIPIPTSRKWAIVAMLFVVFRLVARRMHDWRTSRQN